MCVDGMRVSFQIQMPAFTADCRDGLQQRHERSKYSNSVTCLRRPDLRVHFAFSSFITMNWPLTLSGTNWMRSTGLTVFGMAGSARLESHGHRIHVEADRRSR